jgi:hypothetical protein
MGLENGYGFMLQYWYQELHIPNCVCV